MTGRRQSGRGRKQRLRGKQTLAGKAGRALGMSFTNNAVAKLGTAGVGIVLARMLGPHAFGTYAVAYLAMRVLINLNDLGVTLAIVRWPGEPREITPTVTTISVVTSLVLYGGCYLGAPAYTSAMGAPAATGVVRVLAIVIVIDAVVATPAGLLQRHFRQDLRMIADQVNVWLGTGVTLLLAWFGSGAMSLALGRLAGCLAALVLFVTFSPQPLRLGFNRATARPLLRFGLPLAGSGVIVFTVVNVDQLVVGRTLGVTALGFFVLACNLSNWPVTMFSQPVRSVAPSTFARLRDDPAAMRSGFLTAAGLLGTVALPVCLMMSGSARPLVGFVYGTRWLPAALPLVWLSALAGLQIFFELSYDFFVVLAMSRVVFTMQLVWLLALVPALVAGARWGGVWGLALAEACVAAGLTLPWYLRELRRVGIGPRALAARMRLPVAGAALAGLAAGAAARLAPSDLTALLVSGAAALLIVGGLAYHVRADLRRLRQHSRRDVAAITPAERQGPAGRTGPVSGRAPLLDREYPAGRTGPVSDRAPLLDRGYPAGRTGPVSGRAPLLDRGYPAGSTGPILLARNPAAADHSLDALSAEALPLYRATVESLRWDPAAPASRGSPAKFR